MASSSTTKSTPTSPASTSSVMLMVTSMHSVVHVLVLLLGRSNLFVLNLQPLISNLYDSFLDRRKIGKNNGSKVRYQYTMNALFTIMYALTYRKSIQLFNG